MANIVLSNAVAWWGAYDLSAYGNMIDLSVGCTAPEVTKWGATSKERIPGILEVGFKLAGFQDVIPTTGPVDPDKTLWTYVKGLLGITTVTPDGYAAGAIAWLFQSIGGLYSQSAGHGDPWPWALDFHPSGAANAGMVLKRHAHTGAGTHNGTAVQFGALAATDTMVAHLHGFALSATSCAVKIQSSSTEGFGIPTDRITFTNLTAIGSERKTLAGPITDTWWRAVSTTTGGAGTATLGVACAK